MISIMTVITIGMGLFIPLLEISSSQSDLIPKSHPEQAKYLKYIEEFGSTDNLIIVLEGDTDTLKLSADLFVKEVTHEKKWVKSIFNKIDNSFLIKRAPLFVPPDELRKGLSRLAAHGADIAKIKNLNDLTLILNEMYGASTNPAFEQNPEVAPYVIHGLTAFLEEWSQWIKDPTRSQANLRDTVFLPGSRIETLFKSDGYLFSRDYKMMFLFVQPAAYSDDISYLRPFITDMRKATDRVFEKYPKLKGKIKVSFTGMPAHVYTQTETVYSDVGGAGIISILVVAMILLIGFKSLRKMIIGVVPILSGLIITLGIIAIVVGRLNLISSAMLAILFGIGIDFAIYLIQRTEEELGNGHTLRKAVHQSVVVTSRSIITGGFTTSLAFLSIGFSKFVGFSELGIEAGIGILVMLATTFLFLPPLLFVIKAEPRKYNIQETLQASTTKKRHRLLVVIISVASLISAFSIFASFKMKMDYNVLNLLPRDTESTSYQIKMEELSDYKMSSVVVTSKNIDELKKITDGMRKLSTVSRIDTFSDLIPDRQDEKIALLKKYRAYLAGFSIPYNHTERTASDYSSALKKLVPVFEEAQEKAFAGGRADLVSQLDRLIEVLNGLIESLVNGNRDFALKRTRDFEREVYHEIEKGCELINEWLNPKPVSEKNYSAKFISRFKSDQGTYVAYVVPKGSIWDVDFLDKFINELKSVSSNITGFPVTHRIYVRLAASAIVEAMIYSFLMVVILLIIDFRSIRLVILSLVPLCMGMLWIQGALYLLGIPYNNANIAGLPLLFGLGVVYGVRIVNRWQEKPDITAFAAVKTTGKGVFFAATATITGIFSIVFARHNGISAFGILLVFGLTTCLIAALIVLPAIIDLLYLRPRKRRSK